MAHSSDKQFPPAKPSDYVQTGWGAPIPDNRNSLTAGRDGPLLVDVAYFDKIAKFDRERIPERVVHANGAGAYGYFEVTHDITSLCKANIFAEVGKRTRMLIRFSNVTGERGAADTERDPRGMAMKFYTDEGNWDLVANNTPVFFIRDPMLFPDLIHAVKRNPMTDLKDPNAFWDFMSSAPESVHVLSMLYTDRGIPFSNRHMDSFGNHTFGLINKNGERTWVKFHVKADAGNKGFTSEVRIRVGMLRWMMRHGARLIGYVQAAEAVRGADTDFGKRDLYDFLMAGGEATWTMYIQAIPEKDVAGLPYNIFDVTKVVPHGDYPLIPVGKLVLNEMPSNFFEEIEQAAFCPSNLVPGIEPSPDRVLQGRMLSYTDTQRHRLGPNFQLLPVNRPRCPVHNHQRDGLMAFINPGAEPNYHTGFSTTGGPQANATWAREAPLEIHGVAGRYDQTPADPDDDFKQPRVFWQHVLTEDERERLVYNLAGHIGQAHPHIQKRMVELFSKVDPEYGSRLQDKLTKMAAGVIHPTSTKEPSVQPPRLLELDVKSSLKAHAKVVELGYATASGTGNLMVRDADAERASEPARGAEAATSSKHGTVAGAVGKIISTVRNVATGGATGATI